MIRFLALVSCILTCCGLALGQVQSGGAKAGIGKVFDAAGRSAASKELQQKINGNLLKLAVARSKTAKPRVTPSRSGAAQSVSKQAAPAAAPSYTDFRPSSNSDFVERFAAALSSDPAERQMVRQLVTATRDAFEKEVAKKGRPNNLAAAFTFFVASTVMVYHDDPEPSDQAIDLLWDGMNETLNGLPEMTKLSDAEKQEMYEMLVACGGLVLAGHIYTKSSGDTNSDALYRQLAGELIKTVLKLDPDSIRFNSGGLNLAG